MTGAEDVREHVDRALDCAAANGVPADDVEEIFDEALARVDALRAVRGDE